ncbi:bifunctional tRNA (adenosine(37)-C2)-methyltransferase TrmG/ribosomal RNA large subunit methyltransferase RlmN, partial [Escherichia coli]
MMAMGEPLHKQNKVVTAMENHHSDFRFGLSKPTVTHYNYRLFTAQEKLGPIKDLAIANYINI